MGQIIFLISVGIAFTLLIIHSFYKFGKIFTLKFFIGGLLFSFIRELFYAKYIQKYSFPGMALTIFDVPLAIPVGWVFNFYLAYVFTLKLINPRNPKLTKNFIIIASFFSNFICIPIETAAMNMDWWSLGERWVINDNIAPVGLMSGWWYTSIIFFYSFFLIEGKITKKFIGIPVLFIIFVGILETNAEYLHLNSTQLIIVMIIIAFFLAPFSIELVFIGTIYLSITIFLIEINPVLKNSFFVFITYIFILIYIVYIIFRSKESNNIKIIK